MAKTMARIDNNVVINIEWHTNTACETDTIKNCYGLPIAIGDNYIDGKFYRNGAEVTTDSLTIDEDYNKVVSELMNIIYLDSVNKDE